LLIVDFDEKTAAPVSAPSRRQPSHHDAPQIGRQHLLVFTGTSSWMHQLPASGRIVIGRSETADLRIDDPSVSRQHACITIEGDAITLVDLGSHNGTFVNGARVEGQQLLHANDAVTIHKTTLLLHITGPTIASGVLLEPDAFHQRLEAEIDRCVRYERAFSLLCIVFPVAPADRGRVERTIVEQLRRIDATAWSKDTALDVLLPEASAEEATAIGARIRDKLDADVRMGHATCPTDGYDVDALLATALNVALGAAPGAIAEASREYQLLSVGKERVILADPAMIRLYALVERLAPVDLPILITGETGCGKELVANAVHRLSRRGDKALVSLNCAAIQEMLVESELFGHEKGAFTGAIATKVGLIETASGSTLFLDEIGELSATVQAKLLRVLETQRVTRVGDIRERTVDVRIVAATNRDLEQDVEVGRFRRDLFFRLSTAQLVLPPLRERKRELPLLAAAFLDDACRRADRQMMTISSEAVDALLGHTWPGNVRELKNLMQYLAAAHPEDVLTAEHVRGRLAPRAATEPSARAAGEVRFRPLADELRELEITRIREALVAADNNQTKAAGLLCMPVRTFFEKAKLHGLTPRKKRP
jgi:DNA-binding NtrC family response regulator